MSRSGIVHVLVDAHNVLHHDPELCALMHAPERARSDLEHLLTGQRHVTLFYDGGPGGTARTLHRHGIAIDYSGTGEADERIVAWLRFHPTKRAAVVSNDAELRRRARLLGAALIDARGFLAGFRHARDPRIDRGPLSETEVADWMRIFGIDDQQP